jgi:copper chaperone
MEEVSKLAGVINVAVDLSSGRLTVSSDTPLDAGILRAAVDEAGFELAS